jgi:hypothetical protein
VSFAIVVGQEAETWRDCHLEVDGAAFPAAPWRDRPVVILGWWTENHVEMLRTGRPAQNSFMEGPYEFTVSPRGEWLTIALIRRGRDEDDQLGGFELVREDYERELVRAARAAAAGAPADRDTRALDRNLSLLRGLLD